MSIEPFRCGLCRVWKTYDSKKDKIMNELWVCFNCDKKIRKNYLKEEK